MKPLWPGLVFAVIVAGCFVPTVIDNLRRRRAKRHANVRRRERADAMREAELRRVVDQRDRYMRLYHEAVQRNAVLLGLADVESTPIADGLHFQLWSREIGDAS